MKLIVGLGNPGKKYAETRHNLGFMVLEKIAMQLKIAFEDEKKFRASIARNHQNIFVKPLTFMNESGRAVSQIKNFYKIESKDIVVIHDEVDLDFGIARITFGGSSAGHKGVQSIIEQIGPEFWRVRVGIGKNPEISTEEWVLMKFNENEEILIPAVVDKIGDLLIESLGTGFKEQTIKINK